MGKISVKHYFNNRLKSENIKGEKYNPLYVQIVRNTKTHQIKSVFVTEKITENELNSTEIQELRKQETDFILSFFEFAESAINDFSVSNSKTNLGKLLAFYNANIYEITNDYGFMDYAARKGIYEKLKTYISDKTGLNFHFNHLANFIIKDIPNSFEFYDLSVISELYKLGVFTDKEAGKKEFEILLLQYIIDTNIKNNVHKNPTKLSIFDWYSKRSEILYYIEKKAKYSRANDIMQYAAETDNLLKSLFSDFYNVGIYKNLHKIIVNTDNTLSVVENGKEIHKPQFIAAKKWYE
ncbi:hypothetical protein AGMMS49525_04490 [Bacteroidia bacterium]|nr:hypothetical protein AGMMS49525_04490 [Bacteroidia bacterium]